VEITAQEFAANAAKALAAARSGDEVLITADGITVARLGPGAGSTLLDRLRRDGLLTPPAAERAVPRLPQAEGAKDALSTLLSRVKR